MTGLVLKVLGIWLVMVVMAIVNAALREKVLSPMIGSGAALPVSGILLLVLILLVAFVSVPFFNSSDSKTYVFIGVSWFALTLSFEFLFGRFVARKPWQEIMQVFNIEEGDLFVIALLATLISPWFSARLRGWI